MNDKSAIPDEEVLTYASENGIIDMSHVRLMVEEMQRKKALEQHENKIWQGKTNGLWYTYLVDSQGRRKLVKKKSYDDILNAIAGFDRTKGNAPTFGELYKQWNKDRVDRGRIKKSSADRYDDCHKSYFGALDDYKIDKIKPYTYENFMEKLVGKYNMSAKAFSTVKTIIRGVLKLAKRQGYISFSITEMFDDVDVSDRQFNRTVHEDREEVFDEEEMAKIVEYLKSDPNVRNDAILLMFYTGMRVGEVVALKPEDIQENSISVRRTESRHRNKKGKPVYEVDDFPKTAAGVRDVVVPAECIEFIQRLKKRSKDWTYVFEEHGDRIDTMKVRKRLDLICRKLDIYHKSCHKIRKTYASILLDNHVDEATAKSQLGHESILITERYYHRNRKTLNEREKILSAIPDFQ